MSITAQAAIESSGTPLLPFDEPLPISQSRNRARRAERRTAPASLSAFELIKQRRCRLYRPILEVVAQHGPDPASCLTAREILRELQGRQVLPITAERNDVSPRLCECLLAGCLENPSDSSNSDRPYLKRKGSDATAMTWRITPRGRLLLEHLLSQERRPR